MPAERSHTETIEITDDTSAATAAAAAAAAKEKKRLEREEKIKIAKEKERAEMFKQLKSLEEAMQMVRDSTAEQVHNLCYNVNGEPSSFARAQRIGDEYGDDDCGILETSIRSWAKNDKTAEPVDGYPHAEGEDEDEDDADHDSY